MTSIPAQINYKSIAPSANNRYRYVKVPMINIPASGFTLTPTASQEVQFKIPSSTVINLAQSFIGYQLNVAAQGGGLSTWVFEDTLDLMSNVVLSSAQNADIVNVNNVNKYVKIARKVRTPLADYIANDRTSQLYTCNSLAGNGAPVQATNTALAAVATSGVGGFGAIVADGATAPVTFPGGNPLVGANPVAATGTGSTLNFTEPRYLQCSALNTATVVTRLFPLNAIVETMLSVDKDIYFGENDMTLRFPAGPGNQVVFGATSVSNPTSGPAANAAAITVQNMYLYVAVETNQLIIDSVINKVNTTGLTMNIPFTTTFRNPSGGSVANISIPLTQAYGRTLKRIMHTVWHATEQSNTAMDCANTDGSKVVSYNTYLDSNQLQPNLLVCANPTATAINMDDWLQNQRFMKDSVIQNRAMYQLHWFHCDSFYHEQNDKYGLEDNHEDGLEMNTQRLYSFQATTQTTIPSYVHYTFATFTRKLHITKNAILYV